MKLYALLYLAQKIPADTDFTERELGDILLNWHTFADPATLRRELYDYRFLDRSRDGKVYCPAEMQPTAADLGI